MNKNKIIESIKFHCQESKKYLLEFHLKDENLSQEAIKLIKYSFDNLEKNLSISINNAE